MVNETVICSNSKNEQIHIKAGEFKLIKNFDPVTSILQAFSTWDEIYIDQQKDCKTFSFFDKGTNKAYAFILDKNDKIIAGAIVEYKGSTTEKKAIYQKNTRLFDIASPDFQGNDIQKEKIKEFLINKVNGSKEEFKLVSNFVISEAKQAIPNHDNAIICSNSKSEQLRIRPNEFKIIKNFDPMNSLFQVLSSWDEIHYDKQNGTRATWFDDKATGKTYTFLLDKDNKVVSGAIVEYVGKKDKVGIYQRNDNNFETVSSEFKGNDIQKERIKQFIINKVNGSKEEFKLVSNFVISEAKQAIANVDIDAGSPYNNLPGNSGRGSNFIG